MATLLMIDCQVFQTPAWYRGMGKYSLELLKTLLRNKSFQNDRKIVLLFNKNLPMNEDMLGTVNSALPDAEIIDIDLKPRRETSFLPRVLERNRIYIDQYITDNYPDYQVEFLILSLFLVEGATSFPTNSKKIILMYDLIMLQFFEMYLGLGASDQHFGHYRTLFEADLFLTISETVANDLVAVLGIDRTRIVSIDGGPIKREITASEQPKDRPEKPFILMPTGGDFRKNNYRGVRGFEKFNEDNENKYQLVLTSTFAPSIVHDLNNLSSNLMFTGNVTETELAWLYKHCEGVLFPSEYEGLGLPILEAVDFGKPVACSDISVFREISTKAFYYFDPYDVPAIARSLEKLVTKEEWPAKAALYMHILDKYSWTRSTQVMASAIESTSFESINKSKPKRAIIAPNIMIDNLLGRFVALQHEGISRENRVTYFYDLGIKPRPVRPNYLAFSAPTRELACFGSAEIQEFDEVEYHIADNKGSIHTLMKALALPGDVYLHSPSLETLYNEAHKYGYISSNRLAAEDRLSKINKDDVWLSSLAVSTKRFIVFDKRLYHEITTLVDKLHLDTEVTLREYPHRALAYAVSQSIHTTKRIGFVIGTQLENVKPAFDLALERWGINASYKVFLNDVKEDRYYEEIGFDYPYFIPHIGNSDYRLEVFMQQIDIYCSLENPRNTTTKLLEDIANMHHVEIVNQLQSV